MMATPTPAHPTGPAAAPPRCQVLVVDDDRDIRETLEEILAAEGYEVATARNGADALQVARALHPAVILLDLFMPVMDGVEFRRQQRVDPEIGDIPVVVVSAAAGLDERVAPLGVAQHLEKPLQIETLLGVVSRYCG